RPLTVTAPVASLSSRAGGRVAASPPALSPLRVSLAASPPPHRPSPLVPLAPRDEACANQARKRGDIRMLERDDGRQGGGKERRDGDGRGFPRRAAGAGSGGGRDVAGARARLLRRRHHRALLRSVPPPLQARRGVLAAGRSPLALPPPQPLG
ncbi:unnamed protein product, partial [Urochloa humidicola]